MASVPNPMAHLIYSRVSSLRQHRGALLFVLALQLELAPLLFSAK